MRYTRAFNTALFVVGAIAAAQTVLSFTLPLLALEITATGTGLALIKGAGFVPNIAFAVFIGVLNDRMLKAAAFRRYAAGLALTTVLLLGAALSDRISVPALALFMVVFNGLAYATGNAQMTLIRLTVVEEARLSDATALTSTVHAVITTAGPAVAGFALLQLGHAGVIAACAILLAGAAAATLTLDPAETLPPPAPFLPALREGWAVLRANRELVAMTVVIVLTNAAEGAYATALILKLKAIGADAFEIGVILAAAGVGAVLASRVAAPARRRFGYRTAFFWPIWGLAALYVAVALDWPLIVLGVLSFVEGGLSLFFAIGVWSYRQESTQARHMGRVAGLTGAIFKIGMPPVIVLAGVLSDAGDLLAVFALASAINVAAALYLAYPARWGWPVAG